MSLTLTGVGHRYGNDRFVLREVDLIEEVIRMAGIERVPSRLRGFPAAAGVAWASVSDMVQAFRGGE